MEYVTYGEEQTLGLGRKIGESLTGGEIITLEGELGAGKTVFARGIAAGLGVTAQVVSPTFTLMNEYEGRIKLYHFDAYRLNSAAEAENAGLTEFFGDKSGVCVIEWWENIAGALTSFNTLRVSIEYGENDSRIIKIC